MSLNLKEFPRQLPVTAKGGRRRKQKGRLQRDERRLLVAFRQRMDRQEVEALLDSCGLKLEDAGEQEIREEIAEFVETSCRELKRHPDKRQGFLEEVQKKLKNRAAQNQCATVPDLSRKVTHTALRFWIRADEPIVQRQVDQLVEKTGNKIRWIGPVYQNPSAEGRRGLFCPLPNVLIVQPARSVDDLALAKALKKLGLQEVRRRSKYMGGYRYLMLKNQELEAKISVYGLLRDLRRGKKLVQDAWLENVPLLSAASAVNLPQPYAPDDEFYVSGDQWNLTRIGAEEGWSLLNQLQQNGTELHPVTICILDSDGVDLGHPEFPRERVVKAYTVPGAETDPANPLPPGQADQEDPHGTWCAGIALATTNNKLGVAGIAGLPRPDGSPIFSLMPVRVGETLPGWATGIRYAADAGADVISISMNPALNEEIAADEMKKLDEAISYAVEQKDVVVCVSSGDSNRTNSVEYPATHRDVIACGAVNQLGKRCQPGDWSSRPNGGSSYGNGHLVVAPGVYIPTTTSITRGSYRKGYTFGFGGTSAAAPHVAGLAALILSVKSHLWPRQIRAIIEESALPLPGYPRDRDGWNEEIGYGLINVWRALQLAQQY